MRELSDEDGVKLSAERGRQNVELLVSDDSDAVVPRLRPLDVDATEDTLRAVLGREDAG